MDGVLRHQGVVHVDAHGEVGSVDDDDVGPHVVREGGAGGVLFTAVGDGEVLSAPADAGSRLMPLLMIRGIPQ